MKKKKLKEISKDDVLNHYNEKLNSSEVSSVIAFIKSLTFLIIKAKNYESR